MNNANLLPKEISFHFHSTESSSHQRLTRSHPVPTKIVPMSDKIRHYIDCHLTKRSLSQPKVASAFSMSTRSMQKKLKQEGTNYSKIFDECRQNLAIRLLREKKSSVAEVTYILGFNDQSNFSKAFKRWTGRCPNTFKLKKNT